MGRFIVEKQPSDEYCFELRAANGESILTGMSFPAREGCENCIDAVKRDCLSPVEDKTLPDSPPLACPKYEIYRNRNNCFCFRLLSANREIVALSQEYTGKPACLKGIDSVRANARDAEIIIK